MTLLFSRRAGMTFVNFVAKPGRAGVLFNRAGRCPHFQYGLMARRRISRSSRFGFQSISPKSATLG